MSFSSAPHTNSLALAKIDCHTCTIHQRRCDRNRPRCSSCCGRNVLCGGYPMKLTWPKSKPKSANDILERHEHTNDIFLLEPLSFEASFQQRLRNRRFQPRTPHRFKFVAEGKQNHTPPHRVQRKRCAPLSNRVRNGTYKPTTERATEQCALSSSLSTNSEVGMSTSIPTPSCSPDGFYSQFTMTPPLEYSYDRRAWSPIDTLDVGKTVTSDDADNIMSPPSKFIDPRHLMLLESPKILRQDLFDKFEPLLQLYDRDFCIAPLSGDIPSNPFRFPFEACRRSLSLLHAVIAVSGHHAGRQGSRVDYPTVDIINHANNAIALYRKEVGIFTVSQSMQLLDTTMVLFLYRATKCAFNHWSSDISEAANLLKLSGGPEPWVYDRRAQAQIALLCWWDATIALISRQGCILPCSYLEALIDAEDSRYWSFFDLVGCPRGLIAPMMQLVNLAAKNEKVLSMQSTRWDQTPVDSIETAIFNWENESLNIDEDLSEEEMQQQRDRWNCTEAWRYGLLLYIARVFRWNRKTKPAKRLAAYARIILDHVQCCRRASIVQKQAFIPLFFAGCETKDHFMRQIIRDYCHYWGAVSGYDLFNCASALLEDVWMEQDGPQEIESWWGSVVDKKQRASSQSEGGSMQFCFG